MSEKHKGEIEIEKEIDIDTEIKKKIEIESLRERGRENRGKSRYVLSEIYEARRQGGS